MNHLQGRFIIDDNSLRWLTPLAAPTRDQSPSDTMNDESGTQLTREHVADLYVKMAAGCLKGALFHLNVTCSVTGSCTKASACTLTLMLPYCTHVLPIPDSMRYMQVHSPSTFRVDINTTHVSDLLTSERFWPMCPPMHLWLLNIHSAYHPDYVLGEHTHQCYNADLSSCQRIYCFTWGT